MVRFRQIVTNTKAEADDMLKGVSKGEQMETWLKSKHPWSGRA
jgi:hypothetical protein